MDDLIIGIDFSLPNIYLSYFKNNAPALLENPNGKYATIASVKLLNNGAFEFESNCQSKDAIYWNPNASQLNSFVFNNKRYLIKDFCNAIFKYLGNYFHHKFNDKHLKTVIAVPSYFKEEWRQIIKDSATSSDLSPIITMNEATAIVLNYWQQNQDSKIKQYYVYNLEPTSSTIAQVEIIKQQLVYANNVYYDLSLGINNWINQQVDYFLARVNDQLKKHSLQYVKSQVELKIIIRNNIETSLPSLSNNKVLTLIISNPIGMDEEGPVFLEPMSRKGEDFSKTYDQFILPLKKIIKNSDDSLLIMTGIGSNIKAIKEKITTDLNLSMEQIIILDHANQLSAFGASWFGAIITGLIPNKLVLELTNNLINLTK